MKRILPVLGVIGIIVLVIFYWPDEDVGNSNPVPPPPVTLTESALPDLLPARQATPENPSNSWERLLAENGSPAEDRAALGEIVTNYLQGARHDIRPPLGTNEEITIALTDRDTLGDSAIPPYHPAIVAGRLVDRWGSPWLFHQLSADVIEVRSAGPDRKPYTGDDVAK